MHMKREIRANQFEEIGIDIEGQQWKIYIHTHEEREDEEESNRRKWN